jgi:hypothetical protein
MTKRTMAKTGLSLFGVPEISDSFSPEQRIVPYFNTQGLIHIGDSTAAIGL